MGIYGVVSEVSTSRWQWVVPTLPPTEQLPKDVLLIAGDISYSFSSVEIELVFNEQACVQHGTLKRMANA